MENVTPLHGRVIALREPYAEAWKLINQQSRDRLSALGVADPSEFDYAESKGENTVVFRGEVLSPEDCDAYLELLYAFIVVLKKQKEGKRTERVVPFPEK